jgi:hypothetical protein
MNRLIAPSFVPARSVVVAHGKGGAGFALGPDGLRRAGFDARVQFRALQPVGAERRLCDSRSRSEPMIGVECLS